MKQMMIFLVAVLAVTAVNAAAPATKPVAKPAAKPAPAVVATPPDQTSALFFTTCAESLGSEKEFTKKMQALADVKTVAKMSPDSLGSSVNADEAKNAWAAKGFADSDKPLLLAYNAAQNTCGMHVADIDPEQMRHSFQADLKKFVDQTKSKIKIYKPQEKDGLKVYSIDLLTPDNKVFQLGIAISAKDGKEYLTIHL